MTDLNFDFTNIDPHFTPGSFLPVSDDKGWLVILTGDKGFVQTANQKGYFLELVGVGQDQQVAGQEFSLRFNLQHESPGAVKAAQAQLAALGYVLGFPGRIGNTAELMNKPFRVVSVEQVQNGQKTGMTQLANNGIRDVNGNEPSNKGPQQAQPAPQVPPQMPPQGQQQQPGNGNWQQPGQQQPPQNGNWGGQQPAQQQPPQGQPGNWQQGPQGQPQGGQQPTQGGGAPGWAQP